MRSIIVEAQHILTESNTVTVTKKGKKFVSSFSKLPGKTFGPYDAAEMIRDLRVAALLSPLQARELVMDASAKGSATTEMGY